ncbi:MAG: beta-ketoacyl-[acyl-carrier-protein] synthase family protein, partial [Desulfobacterales bacterium]|nr:beta-ketoacyl-[acyl-carrier-protein] synthase family protein [Desulfobacterales bacterium]
MSRRVVITSIGVVSSLGFSQKEIIDSIKNGRTCFERPVFDDDLIVCPVKNFDIKSFTGRFKNIRYLNRGAQFCVAAAMAAIKDSGVDDEMLSEAGLFVGTGPNLDISGECPEINGGNIDADLLQALFILKFLP